MYVICTSHYCFSLTVYCFSLTALNDQGFRGNINHHVAIYLQIEADFSLSIYLDDFLNKDSNNLQRYL